VILQAAHRNGQSKLQAAKTGFGQITACKLRYSMLRLLPASPQRYPVSKRAAECRRWLYRWEEAAALERSATLYILTNPTTGGVTAAMLGDIILAEPNIGFAGRRN